MGASLSVGSTRPSSAGTHRPADENLKSLPVPPDAPVPVVGRHKPHSIASFSLPARQLNWPIKQVSFNMKQVGQHSLHEQHWTPRLRMAVANALRAMSDFKRPCLDTLLLTYGLVSLGGGIPHTILAKAGITSDKITDALKGSLDAREEVFRFNDVLVADSVEVAFNNARDRARQFNHVYIGTDHVLLALLDDACGTARAFFDALVSRHILGAQVVKELTG